METPSEASKQADGKPVKQAGGKPVKQRQPVSAGRFAFGTASSNKKRTGGGDSAEPGVRSSLMKSTSSMSAGSTHRRSSTGSAGKQQDNGSSDAAIANKKASPASSSDGLKKSKPLSVSTASSKPSLEKKTSLAAERNRADATKKPVVKASPTTALKKVQPKTESSSGSTRRVASNSFLQSPRTPSVSSNASKKLGSQASSADKGSVSSRRKSSTADSRDFRLMMMPQVDFKASDEVVSVLFLHFRK
jgi:hypothetical protein